MIPSRVVSIAWLGWRFVVVQPLRKLQPGPSAKARFAEAYFGEGCVPTAVADREVALAASACTGCGLCEARCPLRALPPPVAAMGLQSIFRLHSKHLGEAREGAALLAACADCQGCDDACPSGVPIGRVVRRLGEIAVAAAARPIARRVT